MDRYSEADVDGMTFGTAPTLGQNIGMAYVATGHHRRGQTIRIQVRKRVETATIVRPPFVTPGSAS